MESLRISAPSREPEAIRHGHHPKTNLTRRQLLMWIGQKLQPEAPDYSMGNLYWIAGPLNHGLLSRAVTRLVEEADALRTVVREVDGVPFQEVLPHVDAEVPLFDLRGATSAAEAAAEVSRIAQARVSKALAMDRCPFDVALFLLPGGGSALYLNLHHMFGDGWSLSLLYNRLSELYGEIERGVEPSPSPLRAFHAYLPIEKAYASSPTFADDEAWWSARLGRPSEPLHLYGEAVVGGGDGASEPVTFSLEAERTERLRALAASESFKGKSEQAAQQNLLCAALAAWLHRIGPNDAVTVGVTFHNRTSELKATIGLFMEVLPVRVEIAPGETFRSLYKKVSEAAAEALKHRRYTVENPVHKRVYDVILSYDARQIGDFAGRFAELEWVFSRHTNVALSVQVHDFRRTGSLHVNMDMQRAAFPEAQRRAPAAAAAHLRRALDALLADPDRPIAEVDVLPPEERDRLIAAGRGPSAPVEIDILPAAFERHAARRGDATAVVFGARAVSYDELNRDANRLARRLRGLGVAQNHRVGIFLDRSPEMVAAILAVLKAGAGYVPLDTSYPPERLRWMIEDCAVRVIITTSGLRPSLNTCVAPDNPPEIVCLDADAALSGESDANLGLPVDGDDLAYVIYTSGSTGRPKGVEIPRRAMANFLQAMRDGDWVREADTMLVMAPLAFDAHVSHIHHPLVVGARLLVVTREDTTDARRLISLIEEHNVTTMGATPTTWRMLLEAGWRGKPDIKLHCGGEALTPDLVQKLRPRVAALWNVYGPTETTVLSLEHRVELSDKVVPVGRPITNTQVYVVDRSGLDAPEGVVGELLIGGEGLARGYVNRPDLTAEKFVTRPEGRVYRTGDLARFLPDGSIEVMGRIDHQVKIRGYRIELGEIEAELTRHPGVAQAAVVVREDVPGDRRLAAYVVAAGRPTGASELRSFLQERLPAFMVPASFATLEKLPLSSNGKVDRGALAALPARAPALAADEPARLPARPLDLLEYQLTHLFEEVLGVARIHPDDSFFALGGSSLLAVRALARIETILGKSVSMQAFFSAPSVTRLAALLRADGWAPSLDTLVPLQPRGSEPPFFCVHAFIGDVCRALAGRFTFGHPFYGLQPRGLDGREAPLETVEEMAAHYVEQIRRVSPRGPYHIGGYCFGGTVAFEMARQLRQAGEEVAMLAIIDAAPSNVPHRGLRSRLRAAVNRGLYALEKVAEIPRSPDPAAEVRKTLKRLATRVSWRARGESAALETLRAQMDGLEAWPMAYQRIAGVHYAALLRYTPGFYDGRVTLIRTNEGHQRWSVEDETFGWGQIARDVDVHRVPGRHDEIMNEPHVQTVAEVLARLMPSRAEEPALVRSPARRAPALNTQPPQSV